MRPDLSHKKYMFIPTKKISSDWKIQRCVRMVGDFNSTMRQSSCSSHPFGEIPAPELREIYWPRLHFTTQFRLHRQGLTSGKLTRSKVVEHCILLWASVGDTRYHMDIPPLATVLIMFRQLCASPISAHHDSIKYIHIHTWLCTSDVSTNDFPFCHKSASSLE